MSYSEDGENFTYTVAGGNATITGYTGDSAVVTIPATIGGYPVRGIGNEAFLNRAFITSLIIPEGVTTLGYRMIRGTAVESITVPSTVTTSGLVASNVIDGAFAGCLTLKTVTFAEGMTTIPAYICASASGTYNS